MKKFKVKYYSKANLSYTFIDAQREEEVERILKNLGIIKNRLQIRSIEEDDGYDDTYEPDLYPSHIEDRAAKYLHPHTDRTGDSLLFNLEWVKPNPKISPVFNMSVDGERIFQFNEREHRKMGVVMCGLFAPHMDCDEYRFEYTLISPDFFKFKKEESEELAKNYQNDKDSFEALSQWMEDTRYHPVFVLKDKKKIDILEGQDRMMAASYFGEEYVAVVIAHKIYD